MSSGSMIFGNCRGKMGDVVFERQSDKEMQRTYYAKHRRNDSLATLESRAKLAICSKAWNFFSRIGATTLTQRQFCKANYHSVPAIPRYIYERDPLGLTGHYWQLFTPTIYNNFPIYIRCYPNYNSTSYPYVFFHAFTTYALPLPSVISWYSCLDPRFGTKNLYIADILKNLLFNLFKRDVLEIIYWAFYTTPNPFRTLYPPSFVSDASYARYVLRLSDICKTWGDDVVIRFSERFIQIQDNVTEGYTTYEKTENFSVTLERTTDDGRIYRLIASYSAEDEELGPNFSFDFEASFPAVSAYDFRPSSIQSLKNICIVKNYGVCDTSMSISFIVDQIKDSLRLHPQFKDEWIQTWGKPYEKSPEL